MTQQMEEVREKRTPIKEAAYYDRPFVGLKRFLAGIVKHSSGSVPFHYQTLGRISFNTRTQKPHFIQEDGIWGRLSTPGDFGQVVDIDFETVKKFCSTIRNIVVRPWWNTDENGKELVSRFDIVHLNRSIKSFNKDGDIKGEVKVEHLSARDEPIAKFLVLLAAEDVRSHGGRNGGRLPTIAELQPALASFPDGLEITPSARASAIPWHQRPGGDEELEV